MGSRRDHPVWWREVTCSEHFNGTERLLLGVSVLTFAIAMVLFIRVVT